MLALTAGTTELQLVPWEREHFVASQALHGRSFRQFGPPSPVDQVRQRVIKLVVRQKPVNGFADRLSHRLPWNVNAGQRQRGQRMVRKLTEYGADAARVGHGMRAQL